MKLCEICKKEKATLPDRYLMGRAINRICEKCHVERLTRDLKKIATSKEAAK